VQSALLALTTSTQVCFQHVIVLPILVLPSNVGTVHRLMCFQLDVQMRCEAAILLSLHVIGALQNIERRWADEEEL